MDIGKAVTANTLTKRQVFWSMAGIMLGMLLASLDQTIVSPAMPRIVADLGGFNQYAWVSSIYMVTSAVVVPIMGKLSDMYGRKIFYILGISIFGLASLACGFSQNITQLIIFRGIQGIGGGVLMAGSFIVIGDLFPPSERAKYQGFMTAVFGFSSVVGPTIGGFLTDQISWSWVFFINVPLSAIVLVIFFKFFPNIKADNLKHIVDYAGLSFLILAVVPLMLALTWGGVSYGWGSIQIIGLLVFAGVAMGIFLFIETRAKEPIMPLSMFKNNVVAICNLASFLTGMGMFGAINFIPLFLQGVLATSATTSGNLMIPMSMTVMVSSFVGGQWLARSDGRYRWQGVVGTAFIALGMLLLGRLSTASSYWNVVLGLVTTGAGMGLTMPVFTVAIQNAVPYSQLGVATSASTFLRSLGGSIGLAILGSIVNNRFLADFIGGIPQNVRSLVPMDQITALAHNPQALVNPTAQEQLKGLLTQSGDPSIFTQVMQTLREALSSSITQAFLVGFGIVMVGLVALFFLKEVKMQPANPEAQNIPKAVEGKE